MPSSPRQPLFALIGCLLAAAVVAGGCGSAADTVSISTSAPAESGATEAALRPVDGSQAAGTVRLIRKHPGGSSLVVDLSHLKPVSNGGQYAIWILASRHNMVPLATYPVGSSGELHERVEADPVFLGTVENGTRTHFLVTRTDNAAEHERSLGGGDTPYDPPFIGTQVLRGTFSGPLVRSPESE